MTSQLTFPTSQIMRYDRVSVLRRGNKTQYIDGKPVPPRVIKEFCIQASVQPMEGRDLLIVPEADRFKEQYNLWTLDEIIVNDEVVRDGSNYQVQSVEFWDPYRKARIMRIDVGPEARNP